MKFSPRITIIGLAAVAVISLIGFRNVSAETVLSEAQIQQIRDNCISIKSNLNQLHASDALLRVNRGQMYEAMGTRLMDRFNSRLAANGQDTTGTTLVTNSYKNAFSSFQSDYRLYEQQLSVAIRIDCSAQPEEFHAAIELARARRATVHADVIALHRYIDDYRSAVSDFLINFQRVTGQ